MSTSLSSEQNAVLEPHLLEFGRGDGTARYPNPFFDLSQQYTPRTVKELFRWCSYFYYTNPLISSTITKISRFPLTNLIYEDSKTEVREKWSNFFDGVLKITDRLMDVNLDLNVYGNAFVSIHLPFTRFLICQNCNTRSDIEYLDWDFKSYKYNFTCPKCKTNQDADTENPKHIQDVPYRSESDIKFVRWNPENISIRYNEATGERHYFYNLSKTLRYQIDVGEKDIIQKLPLLFIQAAKHSRLIRLSGKNLYHLYLPTLAEKDMGWGKPKIQPVLKDLYYMATLRRAQEAIANEHIVPFDFLFPQANASVDPFIHTDLGSWRSSIEENIKKHRRDPNYKAIMPVPMGFGRLGGDGKAMMLTPELNYLNQVIVGGMGIPAEFLFGNLSWSSSSITLRSLQNDFKHNQTQLLELVLWIKNKVRIFMKYPDITGLRFTDFKMADDLQRIQQIVGLNAQRKISNETMLTEFGLDFEKEMQKIKKEALLENEIQEIVAKGQAKISGETQLISFNYQLQLQKKQNKTLPPPSEGGVDPYASESSGIMPNDQEMPGANESGAGNSSAPNMEVPNQTSNVNPAAGSSDTPEQTMKVHKSIISWATKISKLPASQAEQMILQMKQQHPEMGSKVHEIYNQIIAKQNSADMRALPEQRAPTRQGSY